MVRKGNKRKSSTADLQLQTLKHATYTGTPWQDEDVARIVEGIGRDETTFEMAMAIGRTLYSTTTARAKVGFALRHAAVLYEPIKRSKRSPMVPPPKPRYK